MLDIPSEPSDLADLWLLQRRFDVALESVEGSSKLSAHFRKGRQENLGFHKGELRLSSTSVPSLVRVWIRLLEVIGSYDLGKRSSVQCSVKRGRLLYSPPILTPLHATGMWSFDRCRSYFLHACGFNERPRFTENSGEEFNKLLINVQVHVTCAFRNA
eukprot:1155664-Pelagomonas_calceolata.AAC.3